MDIINKKIKGNEIIELYKALELLQKKATDDFNFDFSLKINLNKIALEPFAITYLNKIDNIVKKYGKTNEQGVLSLSVSDENYLKVIELNKEMETKEESFNLKQFTLSDFPKKMHPNDFYCFLKYKILKIEEEV